MPMLLTMHIQRAQERKKQARVHEPNQKGYEWWWWCEYDCECNEIVKQIIWSCCCFFYSVFFIEKRNSEQKKKIVKLYKCSC